MRHASLNLRFLQTFGDGDLDCSVERKVGRVNHRQHVDGRFHCVVTLHEFPAEPLASDFNFFGERDFFFASQQRDFAHLCEIHADRVVDLAAAVSVKVDTVDRLDLLLLLFLVSGQRLIVRYDLHVEIVDGHEKIVEFLGTDGFVRQVVEDLRELEVPLTGAG